MHSKQKSAFEVGKTETILQLIVLRFTISESGKLE